MFRRYGGGCYPKFSPEAIERIRPREIHGGCFCRTPIPQRIDSSCREDWAKFDDCSDDNDYDITPQGKVALLTQWNGNVRSDSGQFQSSRIVKGLRSLTAGG